MRSRVAFGLMALALAAALCGCAPRVDQDQPYIEPGRRLTLAPSHTVGQTVVARHAGLNGVEFWLEPALTAPGQLTLRLRADPAATTDLASAALELFPGAAPGYYRWSLPAPRRDSHSAYYYALIELSGEGEVALGAAYAESYLDGAAYRDHQPQEAQLAFRLVYDGGVARLDAARAALGDVGTLALGALLYILPGWALLALFRRDRAHLPIRSWAEGLGLAIGLSLGVYPLLMLWAEALGLQLGALNAWLPVGGGATALIWLYRPWDHPWPRLQAAWKGWAGSAACWPDVALVIAALAAGLVRLWGVRGLEMPLWDDSVQHTVIVQRMIEAGGLFHSWEPYTPYHTLSTQYGVHAQAAAWAWLTGASAPQAMLIAGQLFNWLAVLALYPLAARIRGPWAGVATVLVAGAMSFFPYYYTNWGRYPQMAGQIALPVAAWWLWAMWQSERPWRAVSIIEGAIVLAGMALVYYRMAFHTLAFGVAMALAAPRYLRRLWGRDALVVVGLVAASALLMGPWIARVLGQHGAAISAGDEIASATAATSFAQALQALRIGWPAPQAAPVAVGTLLAAWLGGAAALPVLWLWALVLLPVLRLTGWPGVQLIQDFTIETSLYIPQALIWGVAAGAAAQALLRRWRAAGAALAALALMVALWRAPRLLLLTDRGYDLSTRPDQRAAAWIRDHLPADAVFCINGIIYTDGVSAVGGDGGWWLPLLTGRKVTIPPQYTLLFEQPDLPGYGEAVNGLVRQIVERTVADPASRAALCAFPEPITHVYLGQRRGMVAKPLPNPPQRPMFAPEELLGDPAFKLIYHQDRVMIFELDRSQCPE